ncbi:DNA glycosylase [Protomyces lactucae-debilis]|uniref:Endonuclease III homolog n=1 Tax=Protomyces lactucae-debilis TaxID=2754530 RepID=A0A1Y2EYN4_PROLT|nr:DNA glycosylase [Protomyces lactucae-debilis]ORY76364.1 DNA glycosylase [Protomyces lactucae-debilis]
MSRRKSAQAAIALIKQESTASEGSNHTEQAYSAASSGSESSYDEAPPKTTPSKRISPRKTTTPVRPKLEQGISPSPKRSRAEAAALKAASLAEFTPPADWQTTYALIKQQRAGLEAPVDTQGCDGHDHLDARTRRLHCLVSLILSSQTKDTVNFAAMTKLKENLPGGLTLESLLEVDEQVLNQLIWAVGFHNTKAKNLKRVAQILRDDFAGDIPKTEEEMIKALPGVGPKMAPLAMRSAWGIVTGIGVDVHVHRIANRLGWANTASPDNTIAGVTTDGDPQETRMQMEGWLPRELWSEVNHMLVGFGQMVCLPRGRRCSACTLSGTGRCPSEIADRPGKKRKVVVKTEIKTEVKTEAGDVLQKEEVKEEVEVEDLAILVSPYFT